MNAPNAQTIHQHQPSRAAGRRDRAHPRTRQIRRGRHRHAAGTPRGRDVATTQAVQVDRVAPAVIPDRGLSRRTEDLAEAGGLTAIAWRVCRAEELADAMTALIPHLDHWQNWASARRDRFGMELEGLWIDRRWPT